MGSIGYGTKSSRAGEHLNAFLTHVMTIEVPAGLRSWFCFPSYSFARPGSHLFVFFDTIGLVMIRCFCLCLCFWHFVFSSAVRSGPFYFSSFLIFSPPCISYPLAWLDLVSSPLTFTSFSFLGMPRLLRISLLSVPSSVALCFHRVCEMGNRGWVRNGVVIPVALVRKRLSTFIFLFIGADPLIPP